MVALLAGGWALADGDDSIGLARRGELMLRTELTDATTFGDFDELYQECRPELVRYAERRNARDAELLADLALIDVYRALDRLRSDHPRVVWAYLYRALDNHLRREVDRLSPELRNDLEELGGSYSFEDDVIGHLSLDDMLAMLSSNQEMALRPKLEKNLTAEEIGAEIGKSADAVRQLQHKAIRRLRRILFVAAMVLMVLLAAVLSDRGVSVDQSPATSGTEQLPPETTVPEPPVQTEDALEVGETSVPPNQSDDANSVNGDQGTPAQNLATTQGFNSPQADTPAVRLLPDAVASPAVVDPPVTVGESASAVVETADPNRLVGSFAVVNLGSGECLDQPWTQDEGGAVIQWRCAGHTALNQVFVATEGNGGTMLVFAHSNKCVDESNQVVWQWTCNGGDNQLFNWNGLQLQSKATGMCLTLGDELVGNGSTLRTTPCTNSPTQQFRLERYGGQLSAG